MHELLRIRNRYHHLERLLRFYCASANVETHALPKAYEDMPGPRGPLGLGNLYKYLPLVGQYSWLQLHKAGFDKYQRYGPIVRETMVPGEDIVWLYDPSDIATLLNAKDYPLRRSHLALAKYRKDRPHIYRSGGLLPTNGAEWWRLRSELQKEISAPKSVRSFLPEVDKVTREFLEYLAKDEDFDVLPKLARLNLELTCLITFGERLNSFAAEEQLPSSRSSKLMRSAETTNSNILPTDQGWRLWRYFETKSYRKLRKAQEYMENVAVDLVSQRLSFFKESDCQPHTEDTESHSSMLSRSCLMDEYLKNPNLDLSDVVGTAADLILAGIDTTSYTSAFALYHIARNGSVQAKLYEEALKVLPDAGSSILSKILNTEIPYTRAVLKEVLRLQPISVGVGRILSRDLVLGGYHVPQGTVVVTQNMIACRLEKNFKDPLKFHPERWIEKSRSTGINPYLVLPFGHGMRACIARRLAEQNMLVLLLRLMRNYKIEWRGVGADADKGDRIGDGDDGDGGEMDVLTLLINKPSQPVTLRLRQRK